MPELGVIMGDDRRGEFLAKAKEAETQAQIADENSKASWLGIAAGYHDLAAREGQSRKRAENRN